MKKKIFLSLLIFQTLLYAKAQKQVKYYNLNVNYLNVSSDEASIASHSLVAKSNSVVNYTIPVVFHILHTGGSENISDSQVLDGLNRLNLAFRKKNPDTVNIIPAFQSIAADVHFEFRLATKDTNGNCTSGIVRHFDVNTHNWPGASSAAPNSTNPALYKYTWNTNSIKYLNIYVLGFMQGYPNGGGYTYFPGALPKSMNVVNITNNLIGTFGTANTSNLDAIALTHEVGHWFGLDHTFASGQFGVTCGDDGISDTPLTKGFGTCPTSPPAICNPPTIENYQNYMDMSSCRNMFTQGQASHMTNILLNSVERNNLWTNANLIATGVINPLTNCAPIADFYTNTYTICAGQSLDVFDISYNGAITSRAWSASGSNIASPSATYTGISFSSPGVYTLSLVVSNSTGSSSATKTITVLNNLPDVTGNYSESFEAIGLPTNFNVISDDLLTWTQTSLAAATGSSSYYIDNSTNPPGKIDVLETPSYDLLNNQGATFTFKYAYAKFSSANNDQFTIQASTDCGGSWKNIVQLSNTTMAQNSGGTSSDPFFPSPQQFVTYLLSSHPNFMPFKQSYNVRFRFVFKEDDNSGQGNNIFLDDINFNSVDATGLQDLATSLFLEIYPNPANSTINMAFRLNKTSDVSYYMTNILGERVVSEISSNLATGDHLIPVNVKVDHDIYSLNLLINGQRIVRKIIVE